MKCWVITGSEKHQTCFLHVTYSSAYLHSRLQEAWTQRLLLTFNPNLLFPEGEYTPKIPSWKVPPVCYHHFWSAQLTGLRGLEFCSLHVWIQWIINSLEQKSCLCLHSLWHSRVPFSAGLQWHSVRGMNHIKGESEWFWVTDTRV